MKGTPEGPDEALVEAAKAGDRSAFGTLVERHQDLVYAIAYSRTGNLETARDIAQDAFLASLENLPLLKAPSRYRAWLARITRRLCFHWHRSESYRRALVQGLGELGPVEGASPPEKILARNEDKAMIQRAVDRLPLGSREALLLYYYRGCSVAQTAAILGIAEGAVLKRLERAKRKMRDLLATEVEATLKATRPPEAFTKHTLAAIPAGSICARLGLNLARLTVAEAARELIHAVVQHAPVIVTGGVTMTAKKAIVTTIALLFVAAGGTGYLVVRYAADTTAQSAPEAAESAQAAESSGTPIEARAAQAQTPGIGRSWQEKLDAQQLAAHVDKWVPGWTQRIPLSFLEDPKNAFNRYLLAAALMEAAASDPRCEKAKALLWTSGWDWNDPDHIAIAQAYLDANAEALAQLKAAIEAQHYQAPPVLDFSSPPYLVKFRQLSRLLLVELELLMNAKGDKGAALEHCLMLVQMGHHVGAPGLNVLDLPTRVGLAINATGGHYIPELLSQTQDADACMEVAEHLRQLAAQAPQAPDLMRKQFELWVNSISDPQFLEQIKQYASSFVGHYLTPELLAALSNFPQDELERQLALAHSLVDSRLNAMEQSYWQYLSMPALRDDQRMLGTLSAEEFDRIAGKLMIDMATLTNPAAADEILAALKQYQVELGNLLALEFDSLARNLVTHVARMEVRAAGNELLAGLKLYQLETGSFPDDLDQLVPAYLPRIPTDPFSGAPFKYIKASEGVMVYSVGPDMKDDLAKKITTGGMKEGDVVFEIR